MRVGFYFGLVVLAFGCKADEHEAVGPVCTELGEVCHEAGEAGNAEAEACHEVGHAGDEAACEAEIDACTVLCESVVDTGE